MMVSKNTCLKFNMSLSEEDTAACTALKATMYKSDIKYVILDTAGKVALIVKYVYLLSIFSNVAHNNYHRHSDISIVFYKVLIYIIIKLPILNKHKFIFSCSFRLPAMFALILMSLFCIFY